MAESVTEEYQASLQDLNFNSKPHINMLTMLAEENNQYAPLIVDTIVNHIKTVQPDLMLPSLYLVDSIMKNLGGHYIALFSKHMVSLFTRVFSKVDEDTRAALYKLRQTWNEILSKNILYDIDCNAKSMDPAWPITAKVPVAANVPVAISTPKNAIHVNPKFLGGPSAQAPPSSRNQVKPTTVKKNENVMKDPEKDKMTEMKNKQEEMLRMIEEKKIQLKALEQKKLEMAAKQKKKSAIGAVISPHPNIEVKTLNNRDPRLKKSVLASQSIFESSKNAVPLQSVVVVPKIPLESNVNQIQDQATKTIKKGCLKSESPNLTDDAVQPAAKVEQGPKVFKEVNKNESSERISNENNMKKPFHSREHVHNRNAKFHKKHPLSPEKKTMPAKIFCKDSVNKKRTVPGTRLQHSENAGSAVKKGKFEAPKVKIEPGTESHISSYPVENSLEDIHSKEVLTVDHKLAESCRGSRDMDYRHHSRNANVPKMKQWGPQGRRMHPRRPPNSSFSRVGNRDNRPVGEQKFPPVKIEPDEKSVRNKEFRPIENLDKPQNVPEIDASRVNVKTEIPDSKYNSKPVPHHDRLPLQQPKSFMLDGKNRKLYFVNDCCFTIMDNNEPREITFSGGPRNVYIEGLSKPLVLAFDGRPVEFETDCKRNVIRFGAPSREVYVNNYPYEACFGGQPFTAMLEDKKEHRIRIDGPPPQVIISDKPAYDLYEIYSRDKRISPIPAVMDSNLNNKGTDNSMLQDVDMRSKPNHIIKSSIISEGTKDVDWRRVPLVEGPKLPWNMPQDVPAVSNMNYSSQSGISAPSHWDSGSNKGIHCDNSSVERNNSSPWPLPAYRGEVMQHGDRPLIDQSARPVKTQAQAIPPNSSWEPIQSSLPPPPAIPPSLSNLSLPPNLPNLSSLPTSTLQQLPNVSLPPPSWNPLPPPPMFAGSLPETLKPVPVPSAVASSTANVPPETVAAAIAPVPINVETIYEKLVAAGIITEKPKDSTEKTTENTENSEDASTEKKDTTTEEETPEPEILLTAKSLRQFRPSIITALYKGSQCATCGMRFKEIQSEQYSRHLDWHFRMNRREKDGAKKAYSRRLFYEIKDWIQFNEIEEAEERTPSYFELQADGDVGKNDEKEKIQSVPASECETEKCSVCGEQFQLFWVEEEEEWHLKHAVSHDGEAYHPMCYEDFKKATESAKKQEEESLLAAAKEQKDASSSEETPAADVKKEPDEDGEKEPSADSEKELKMELEPDKSDESTENLEEKPADDKPTTEEAEPTIEEAMEVDVAEEEKPATEEAVEEERQEKTVVSSSDSDLDEFEDEFRPPTPDPRFDVQPPVLRGSELSALCTIM